MAGSEPAARPASQVERELGRPDEEWRGEETAAERRDRKLKKWVGIGGPWTCDFVMSNCISQLF